MSSHPLFHWRSPFKGFCFCFCFPIQRFHLSGKVLGLYASTYSKSDFKIRLFHWKWLAFGLFPLEQMLLLLRSVTLETWVVFLKECWVFQPLAYTFGMAILWKLVEKAFGLTPLRPRCFLWIDWDWLVSCLNWAICAVSCSSCLKIVLYSMNLQEIGSQLS